MFLTNALNLTYQHRENKDLYTLLYRSNLNCDPTEVNEQGMPKWIPTACYRNEETGEVFSRPIVEFEDKFIMVFPSLEKELEIDFAALEKLGAGEGNSRRRIALLGMAKELWSLFPLVPEDHRIKILRSLLYSDFVDHFDQDYFIEQLGDNFANLPRMLHIAGSTLRTEENFTSQFDKVDLLNDVESGLPLLMLSLAASVREYHFLNAITVEVSQLDAHHKRIDELVESIKESAEWFIRLGLNVALPTFTISNNSYEEGVIAESN